jgi:LPXTG-site transpeptidase (sortase) family protein
MPKRASLAQKKKTTLKKKTLKKRAVFKNKQKLKLKSHVLRNRLIGICFIILAFVILFMPVLMPKPAVVINKNPIKINSLLYLSKDKTNNPVRILIPKADIDLPIVQAKVVNGYWELSESTASYGLGSGQPGTKGNIVIFAHARVGLFYNLKDVKISDTIYVFTKNKWYRYKVNKITAVYPNQTDVIQPTKSEVLTLYTCTGFTDEKRLIVQAIPQN